MGIQTFNVDTRTSVSRERKPSKYEVLHNTFVDAVAADNSL